MTDNRTILLIDANALIHRAYHALPKDLQTPDGTMVNAVYGFTAVLLQTLGQFKPGYVFFLFDAKGPTFREVEYKEYKAQRPEMEELLRNQYPLIKELLADLHLPVMEKEGFEADDIIGTLSDTPELKNYQKIIITGDRDLLQLVDADTQVYLAGGGFQQAVLYDEAKAQAKLQFAPEFLVDYKGLNGDPSDNIPGVSGIGHISATTLISQYNTLENVYAHLDELKTGLRNKLQSEKAMAFLSRKLATIVTDVDLQIDLEKADITNLDKEKTVEFFKKMQFRSLISRFEKLFNPKAGGTGSSPDKKLSRRDNEFRKQVARSRENLEQPDSPAAPAIRYEKFTRGSQKTIETEKDYTDLTARLAAENKFVLRCKIESRDMFSKPDGIIFGYQQEQWYLPAEKLTGARIVQLQDLFAKSEIIAHDAKRELHALLNLGFREFSIKWDIMLLAYLLAGGSAKFDLDSMVFQYFGEELQINGQRSLLGENEEKFFQEAHYLWHLSENLIPRISAENEQNSSGWSLFRLYTEIEQPLITVLLQLDRAGIKIDKDYLQKFAAELTGMIADLQKKIYHQADREFNIASPKQLAEVLFGKLKLTGGKKTKTGGFSTNERILLNLINDHPIIPDILSFRELFKLKSTYTQTLIDQINSKTGKLHTTFQQAVAATGRLASRDPNLQNIPISSEWAERIRRAFVADPGTMLVSFDYSQQELRLLAHFSQEEKLIETFKKNEDIHSLTASQIFQIPQNKVTARQRRVGKTVNFGVVYGISAYGLSQSLKIPVEEAQDFIDSFYVSYPKVREFFHNYLAEARQQKYVQTIMGRRRDTLLLSSANFQVRSATEREINNFPLQGGAADMMKLAMLRAEDLVRGKYAGYARMILQVHDELIFSVNTAKISDKRLLQFVQDIKSIMLHVWDLSVPMKVETEIGKNWHEMEKIA